jgi:hypothetical protein
MVCGGLVGRVTATAQQVIGPLRRPVIGLADFGSQPRPDLVQAGYRRVDRVHRVGGAPAGMGIRFLPGLPDRQLGGQVIDATAED